MVLLLFFLLLGMKKGLVLFQALALAARALMLNAEYLN